MGFETSRDLFTCVAFCVILWFFLCQDSTVHFLVFLMKLEMGAILILSSLEDSYGFIIFLLVVGVVEGAVGLSILVEMSRSSGADRASLGLLVAQPQKMTSVVAWLI